MPFQPPVAILSLALLCRPVHLVSVLMAHLQWSSGDFDRERPPNPWEKIDMLPSAFNVVEAAAMGPAKARLAFLSRDRPPMYSGVGKLYVGSCESAVQWAGQHVGFIINCADKSYSWHPFCVRFWLNPGYRNTFRSVSWEDRMIVAAKLVLAALMFGVSVLLHCRQGKHRSDGFCVLILALLLGTDIDSALEFYFSKRPDLM